MYAAENPVAATRRKNSLVTSMRKAEMHFGIQLPGENRILWYRSASISLVYLRGSRNGSLPQSRLAKGLGRVPLRGVRRQRPSHTKRNGHGRKRRRWKRKREERVSSQGSEKSGRGRKGYGRVSFSRHETEMERIIADPL